MRRFLGLCALFSISVTSAFAKSPAPDQRAVFEPVVRAVAQSLQIDPDMATAIVTQESAWRPTVVSPKGARGLMQLMPSLAAHYQMQNINDPVENIIVGLYHFKYLMGRYKNYELALAAYNSGESAVDRYGGIPPYRETMNYVRSIMTKAVGSALPTDAQNGEDSNNLQTNDVPVVTPYNADTALDLSSINRSDTHVAGL
tara:strand:- start:3795 stop:4394 length:600 start_codon:yes stop_codon:yes gene_type:complete